MKLAYDPSTYFFSRLCKTWQTHCRLALQAVQTDRTCATTISLCAIGAGGTKQSVHLILEPRCGRDLSGATGRIPRDRPAGSNPRGFGEPTLSSVAQLVGGSRAADHGAVRRRAVESPLREMLRAHHSRFGRLPPVPGCDLPAGVLCRFGWMSSSSCIGRVILASVLMDS